MVHVCLSPSELVDPTSHLVDTFVVIGTAKGYQEHFSWVCSDVLKVLLVEASHSVTPESKKPKVVSQEQELLQSIASGLQPGLDAGVSTECWLRRPTSSKPLRVVLGVLPISVSRHNSPGQPYAITSLLKKHVRPKEFTAIVPLCESSDYILSTACAIARVGGPLMYNRKTGGGASQTAGIDLRETAIPSANFIRVVFPFTIDKKTQEQLAQLALGIQLTRRLVDSPCNELNTQTFTEQALEAIHGMEHVTSRVIKGHDLEKKGFGGLWGVGKAAVHPPAMVILMYEPPSAKGKKSITLVGKGVVFDTGGLQIKTKAGMPGMKRDMGGAAAILSAFLAAVRSGTVQDRPLHAILCLAENSVASNATRADDILTMYSGKTVEINNTDAEGRLVLGDGVASAIKHLNPQVIIDMATLTGAQGVATGKYFGAVYCNDEGLEQIAVKAGRKSGDLCHPVPYAPEFFRPEFQSAVADMKNSVADRANAQVSCAGQFIANHMGDFLENGGQWMHIDMAYCSFDKKDERATGYGVALLYSIIQSLSESP
jgi:probable aminopeptidase NPEPL1